MGMGALDLAVANRDGGEVSVLLGQGNGSMGPPQSFPVGTTPFGIALGDLNGDGRLDVVVANRGSGDVSVLLNQSASPGVVTFAAQARYGAGTTPTAVAIGDVDGDGRPELAVTDADGGVSVLFQPYAGGGAFDPGVFYETTGGRSSAVAVQDLDGDGRPDLAVANLGYDMGMEGRGGNVDVLLNQGNGTFGQAVGYLAGQGPFALAIADIDEDRRVDIVVANQLSNDVHVLRNQGSGTFAMPRVYPTGLEPYAVAVGDLNDDQHLDLAVANAGYNRTRGDVSVLLNRGQGTFVQAVSYPAGQRPAALAVADFNGDGRIDLAVANAATDDVILLQGQLGGTFMPAGGYAAGENPAAMAVGDLNADGRPDIVVVGPPRGLAPGGGGAGGPNDQRLHVLLGQDGGRFAPKGGLSGWPQPDRGGAGGSRRRQRPRPGGEHAGWPGARVPQPGRWWVPARRSAALCRGAREPRHRRRRSRRQWPARSGGGGRGRRDERARRGRRAARAGQRGVRHDPGVVPRGQRPDGALPGGSRRGHAPRSGRGQPRQRRGERAVRSGRAARSNRRCPWPPAGGRGR